MTSSADAPKSLPPTRDSSRQALQAFLRHIRRTTEALTTRLADADATVQFMPQASPAKWHLAHTSWFFEAMVLQPYVAGYR